MCCVTAYVPTVVKQPLQQYAPPVLGQPIKLMQTNLSPGRQSEELVTPQGAEEGQNVEKNFFEDGTTKTSLADRKIKRARVNTAKET